tara:strand:+ start:52 stop:213 length:162 start_codon:yes stop_codon:yes gene_type:complete
MTTSKTLQTGKSAIIAKVCEDLELFVIFQNSEHKVTKQQMVETANKFGEMTLL